jgi:hypothetical protein
MLQIAGLAQHPGIALARLQMFAVGLEHVAELDIGANGVAVFEKRECVAVMLLGAGAVILTGGKRQNGAQQHDTSENGQWGHEGPDHSCASPDPADVRGAKPAT